MRGSILSTPIISIIMPVFKVEKYLNAAVDSVLAQTLENFELILIDDGSPDNCGKICDEYSEQDTRIHVIHQKNQGVSVARNKGLEIAQGTYIGFVDPDDWIEPTMLENMCGAATTNNADMVICGYREVITEGKIHSENPDLSVQTIVYSGIEGIKKILELPAYCCIRIIKQSCIGEIRFQKGVVHAEDLLFMTMILEHIEKFAYLNQKLYAYRIRECSAVQRPFYEKFLDTIIVSEYCMYVCLKKDYRLKSVCYFRVFRSLYQSLGKLEQETKQTRETFDRCILFLREKVKIYYPHFIFNHYISLKYKCFLGLFMINPKFYFFIKPLIKKILKPYTSCKNI